MLVFPSYSEGDVSTVVQKESQPALEGHVSSLQDSTVERRSADVHKLLLAESSTDTSKDQCRFGVSVVFKKIANFDTVSDDGNLLGYDTCICLLSYEAVFYWGFLPTEHQLSLLLHVRKLNLNSNNQFYKNKKHLRNTQVRKC